MQSKTHRFPGKSAARRSAGTAPAKNENYVAGVPLARVIPRALVEREDAVLLKAPRSLAGERFRRLASTLLAGQDVSKVIVVSSSFIDGTTRV